MNLHVLLNTFNLSSVGLFYAMLSITGPSSVLNLYIFVKFCTELQYKINTEHSKAGKGPYSYRRYTLPLPPTPFPSRLAFLRWCRIKRTAWRGREGMREREFNKTHRHLLPRWQIFFKWAQYKHSLRWGRLFYYLYNSIEQNNLFFKHVTRGIAT